MDNKNNNVNLEMTEVPKQEKKVYDKLNIKISLNLKYIEK